MPDRVPFSYLEPVLSKWAREIHPEVYVEEIPHWCGWTLIVNGQKFEIPWQDYERMAYQENYDEIRAAFTRMVREYVYQKKG